MAELHVVALIPAKPGSEDVVRDALTTLAAATQDHQGCLHYELFESAAAPNTFVTVERWTSQEDLDAHMATEDIATALGAAEGHLAGDIAIHPLRPVTPFLSGMLERPTPYLLVDPAVLSANVHSMARFAHDRGLLLRPHAKTHKTPQIAERQLAAGATGLTVATVSEAEAFADAGVTDLFLAYPVWVDAARGARLRALTDRAAVRVGIDSVEGARALAAQVPGCSVVVEVDSGQHRSGVEPDEAGVLAECGARTGLDVVGVFSFPGHSYVPGIAADVAAQESTALRTAVESLAEHGIEARVVSGGSTPTAAEVDSDVLTEMRPGVYVFNDAQQWELGTATPDTIALCCVATVVSHAGGNVLLDAGSKALGADRQTWATGYGRLPDHPDARITLQSEHHAVVAWDDSPRPEIGSRVRVAPNHVCVAVNLHDELVSTDGDVWPVTARGANT